MKNLLRLPLQSNEIVKGLQKKIFDILWRLLTEIVNNQFRGVF